MRVYEQTPDGATWRDADGYRHFFKPREVVPQERRDDAKLGAEAALSAAARQAANCPGCERSFAIWGDVLSLREYGLCSVCHLWDTRREDPKFRTVLSYVPPNPDGTPVTDVMFAFYEVIRKPTLEEALAAEYPARAEALILREELLRLRAREG